ncbi:MAG: ABC transporter substrate-binding protein [Defluviitaleaceae bacterium]|nr:ABC transporter substrate-binding protein [Defluviitaleaceae bacterium]MCL2836260.1 ABC transporter substrate-binding protein [Defluviitaleaceae bacterium]
MKKRIAAAVLALAMAFALASCQSEDSGLTRVRLNEVVHSIFYAPQYVALELGFFEEEGLEIILTVGNGADRTMTALITGEADIGLMGTEAALYVYNEGREDFAVAFAQLTQRAGNFLVARAEMPDFTWNDVAGATIIGGRAGGMPQMVLEYIVRQNGMDPKADVEILTNLQFTSTAGAFTGGIGDFTVEFEPSAFALEQAGIGHVVAYLGRDSGAIPYTVYMATQSYIENNAEIIQRFTNAIQRGMTWVAEHSSMEIAEAIHPHFREFTIEDLAFMIERHKQLDAWNTSCIFLEDGFILLQDIMEQGGELARRVPFDELINTEFALNAAKE